MTNDINDRARDGGVEWPPNYWANARFYYFRDDNRTWGVADRDGEAVVTGLDKNDAAAVACILNGDRELARSLLQ